MKRRIGPYGYVFYVNPFHPNASKDGRVAEHTIVASKALGKGLPKGAVVHHINGNVQDNRPENLVICENQSYHRLLHCRMNAIAKRKAAEASHD
jgi:hypothetical protein